MKTRLPLRYSPSGAEAEGELWLCVRAVVPIRAGDEVTISYVADLCAPLASRAAALSHHGFAPEARPCDAALDGLAGGTRDGTRDETRDGTRDGRRDGTRAAAGDGTRDDPRAGAVFRAGADAHPLSAAERGEQLARLHRLLSAADADWVAGQAAVGGGALATGRDSLLSAAGRYAELLRAGDGVVAPRHALLTHARARLATVMAAAGSERSCRNSLPLWREVISATRACVPEAWPQLQPLLRSARDAAAAAGDVTARDAFARELAQVVMVLRTACDDVDTF